MEIPLYALNTSLYNAPSKNCSSCFLIACAWDAGSTIFATSKTGKVLHMDIILAGYFRQGYRAKG